MPTVRIVWWNVQRLLSPADSTLARELDATPRDGWTVQAYERKIEHVAAVLRAICPAGPPGVLGLAEVENGRVTQDLLTALDWPSLQEVKSHDDLFDGYDVTIFYSTDHFQPIGEPAAFNVHNRYRTRDLYQVLLGTAQGEELMVIANHWPSRMLSNSPPLRIGVADYCSRLIETTVKFPKQHLRSAEGGFVLPARSLLEQRWNRPVLVFGDFNDEPFDVSVSQVLAGSRSRPRVAAAPRLPVAPGPRAVSNYLSLRVRLYNPCWRLLGETGGPPGSYVWNGDWYLLDQMLFSRGLLAGSGPTYVEDSLRIERRDTVDGPHGPIAMTTPSGYPRAYDPKSGRGVSDHLPLVCELTLPD